MNTDPHYERSRRDDLSAPPAAPLSESEQRYRTLFAAMEEGFCVVEMVFDAQGKPKDYRFLEFNDAFGRMTGIAAEAALAGRSVRELYPTLEEFWYETYGRVATTGESVRFENRAEAMGKWFEVHAFRIGGEGSREVGILFKDVSERRRADLERERLLAEAREREAFLRLVTDRLPVRVGYIDRDYRYRFLNGAYERVFGVEPGKGVGMTIVELAGAEPFRIAKGFLDRAFAGESHTEQFTVPYAFGERRVEVQYVADRDETGEVRGVVVHVVDVTERHATTEALREREERYRILFDSIDEGFCVIEMRFDDAERPVDYLFREVNAAFESLSGLSARDALAGRSMREMVPTHEDFWFQFYGRVALTGEPGRVENQAEGLGRWFEAHAFRIGGEGSREVGVLFKDVTARRRHEAALAAERERLIQLLDKAPAFTAVLEGPELTFTFVNDDYRKLAGHRDVLGLPVREAFPEVEGQGFFELLDRVVATGEPFRGRDLPVQLQREPGGALEERYINLLYQAMLDADGKPYGVFAHGIDVTDSVRARRELEVEQAKLRNIFEQAPAFIAVLRGRDLVFEYVNEGYYQLTGHRPMIGLAISEALPEATGGGEGRDYDRLLRDIMDAGAPRTFTERPVTLQRTPDGPLEERFLDLAYLPLREADGAVSGILVHGIDVTESTRAKAERERLLAELAAEREKLDTVLSLSPSFVTIIRGESLTFEYANPAYKRAVGREDLVGRTLFEAMPEVVTGGSAGQEYDRFLFEVMAKGETLDFPSQPIKLETLPGVLEERVLDFTYQPLRDREGNATAVLVHGVDVTDRARAERDIAEREELFRTVFEQAPDDAILVMDAAGALTAWNPAAERIVGWRADEVIGRPADLIFTPEDVAAGAPAKETSAAAREGKAEDERWHLRKDGTRFWGSGTMNALHDAEGNVRGYLKVFRDATERYEETKTLAFLRLLTDALIDQRGLEGIVATVERMLGEYLGASRVVFAEASPEGEGIVVRQEWGPGMPSLLGFHRLDDYGPLVAGELRAGRTQVSLDAVGESTPENGLLAVTSNAIGSGISVPVLNEGRLASVLVVHQSVARDWTSGEIGLVQQVADRMVSEVERARAEAALRASEERFRAAQETTPEPFAIMEAVRDAGGKIVDFRGTYVNPAFERMMGATEADILGASLLSTGETTRDAPLFKAYVRTVETGAPFAEEMPLRYGGEDFYMRLAVSKVGDGVATSYTDLTERYVEAQALAFLSLLTEAVIDVREPDRILETIERMLGHYLGVSRVTFGEFADDGDAFVVRQEWGPEAPSVAGRHTLSTFGPRAVDTLRAGHTYVIRDAAQEVGEPYLAALRSIGVLAAVTVPVMKDGRMIAIFVVHHHEPRDWTDDEVGLVQQVSDRMSAEIERARAEAALRTSEERFRQLVELSPVTVWFGETDGGLSYISQDFYESTGLTPEEALPTGWATAVHPEDLAFVAEEWATARREEAPYDTEFRIRQRDGEYRWISARALPVRNAAGEVVGWLGSNNDIQERKNLEETLQGLIEERTEELQRAVREAEGFNYSISHDLRSPLRAMAATSSILLEEIGSELGEDHREMLVRQNENAKRLGRLIDELLRLSRLSRVPVKREPLDMTQKVHRVVEELRQSDTTNGCQVEVQAGMTAEGDPGLVRTVLQNLIGNACKFSPPGGTVHVGRTAGVFWVRDKGVGFDMQFAPKIFLPFERLVTESEFPGTGIGLANVKRIVERHEGRVWVESEPGEGATFFFTLGE